jgi:hypothetical protein
LKFKANVDSENSIEGIMLCCRGYSAFTENDRSHPPPGRDRAEGEEMTNEDDHLAGLDRAIRLRWILRDIRAKRTKLSPVSPDDLRTLIDMGLVEMRDDVPVLTRDGDRALD